MKLNWQTFWAFAGAIGTCIGAYYAWQAWFAPRKVVEATVSVVGVERASDKDGDNYIAFAVNCLLNNAGTVGLSIIYAQPYTFGPGAGVLDRPLTKAGVNPLSKPVVQTEGGKQEPFQVLVYFHKTFIDEGVRQQLFVAPPGATGWLPGAGLRMKIRFEATTGKEYWDAAVPPQQFAFIGGVPKVVNPLNLTPVPFSRMPRPPVRMDLFR